MNIQKILLTMVITVGLTVGVMIYPNSGSDYVSLSYPDSGSPYSKVSLSFPDPGSPYSKIV